MMMWPFFLDGESPGRHDAADADADLSRRVGQMLTADPAIRRHGITITVQNRVVMLSGTVDSRHIRDAITAQVHQVPGVRDICDALVVRDDAPSTASGGIGEQDWIDAFESLVAPLRERTPERCAAPAPARRTGTAAARGLDMTAAVLVVLIVVLAWPAVLMFWSLVALMAGVLLDRRPPRRR